jgi:hypothetical protein
MLVLACTVVTVAACATAAQREAAGIVTKAAKAKADFAACMVGIAGKPEYAALVKHIPNDISAATIEQKADQSLPTAPEAKSVLAWRSESLGCRQTFFADVQGFAPGMAPVLTKAYNASDQVWVKLVHREVSWGGAIQQLADIQVAGQEGTQAVAKEMTADLEQQHQAELAQRRAFGEALAQAGANIQQAQQNQQLINAINRPRTTTCNAFGNTASCTSY